MIMICNAPDEVVKSVKMGTWCGSSVAEKMIANGIPLDEIRAEIGTVYEGLDGYDPDSLGRFLSEIDKILDNYKAETEEK